MSMMKLVWKNILFTKVRYVIVIIITALVLSLVIFFLCAYRESQRQIENINQDYGGSLTVTRYLIGASPDVVHNPPQLTLEECLAFKRNKYVSSVEVLSYNYCAANDDTTMYINDGKISWIGWNLFVIGYNMNQTNVFTNAKESDYVVGRCFQNDSECVVSDVTATQYGLRIGDTIEIKNNSTGISIKLRLVGIISSVKLESRYSDARFRNNYIFTTMDKASAFAELRRPRIIYGTSQPYYDGYNFIVTLDSYKNYLAFQQLLMSTKNMINGYEYGFIAEYAKGGYEALIDPLNEISGHFYKLTLLLLALFLLMVATTTLINTKAEKHQFGILRSMGMKKASIFFEFCIEQSIVFITGIVFGSILGIAILYCVSVRSILNLKMFIDKIVICDVLSISICSAGAVIIILLISLYCILRFNPLKILRN